MSKHHSVLGGVALALALILTGCSDDSTDPDATDTPTATPTETPTSASPAPKTPEEKAAAQLTAYLGVRDDAFRAATIDFKRLNKVATGDEFLQVQARVADLDLYKIKVTGEYVHTLSDPRPRTAKKFIITDCEDRSGVKEMKGGKEVPPAQGPNGQPLGNPLPTHYTVVLEKGRWLVSEADVRWEETC
ncbi:hypothetical protein [Nocardioides currus]|uniref:Lipoprotein n=1 Tax=Nocardioides currus TaxID=2133958 RepID=A0A2R7YSV6_9ACTN|nr:hypothetical protein [Nocardioides currus]PUA79481.1 hypothetical protein C7S10_19105 [Nocardioides currus]